MEFSKVLCKADFGFKKISSWSKWLSVVCPKWACIYDTRIAYSLNAINYISGAEHKIFPIPEGRNTQINILDVATLLLSRKLYAADSIEPKAVKKRHFVSESAVFRIVHYCLTKALQAPIRTIKLGLRSTEGGSPVANGIKAKTIQLLTYIIQNRPSTSITSLMKISYIIDLVAISRKIKIS